MSVCLTVCLSVGVSAGSGFLKCKLISMFMWEGADAASNVCMCMRVSVGDKD